jgi:hypothetical protein
MAITKQKLKMLVKATTRKNKKNSAGQAEFFWLLKPISFIT